MSDTVAHKLLDGRRAAAEILGGVARDAAGLAEQGWAPRLISVTIGEAQAVEVYVRNQRRRAEACGIAFEERNFAASVSRAEIVAAYAVAGYRAPGGEFVDHDESAVHRAGVFGSMATNRRSR